MRRGRDRHPRSGPGRRSKARSWASRAPASRWTASRRSCWGSATTGPWVRRRILVRRDLDDLQRHGFNWLRVWATWAAFDHDVSAVDAAGRPREPFLGRLKWLVAECDRRGLVVDVTLTRGDAAAGGAVAGPRGAPASRRDAGRRAEGASQLVPRPGQRARRPRRAPRAGRGAEDAPGAGPAARSATGWSRPRSAGMTSTRRTCGRPCSTLGLDFVAPHRPRDADRPARPKPGRGRAWPR